MREPATGEVIVRQGTTVSLECKANGNPVPQVSWIKIDHSHRRKHKKIHNKDLTNNGMILTLRNIDRRDSGTYNCTADNGVAPQAHSMMDVKVLCKFLSPPKIKLGNKCIIAHSFLLETSKTEWEISFLLLLNLSPFPFLLKIRMKFFKILFVSDLFHFLFLFSSKSNWMFFSINLALFELDIFSFEETFLKLMEINF